MMKIKILQKILKKIFTPVLCCTKKIIYWSYLCWCVVVWWDGYYLKNTKSKLIIKQKLAGDTDKTETSRDADVSCWRGAENK